VDKGVSDLDVIAILGSFCDVHFGHGGSVLLMLCPKSGLRQPMIISVDSPTRTLSVTEKAPPKKDRGRGADISSDIAS
jgi:hypothetical protein